jgi:hypothetical protein
MYRLTPPTTRIYLFANDQYLAGLMVAQTSGHFSKVYEHTTTDKAHAIRFCEREAAESFAKALNHHGGTIWNVVEFPPEVVGG